MPPKLAECLQPKKWVKVMNKFILHGCIGILIQRFFKNFSSNLYSVHATVTMLFFFFFLKKVHLNQLQTTFQKKEQKPAVSLLRKAQVCAQYFTALGVMRGIPAMTLHFNMKDVL
jgi:hypothetical protein